MILTRNFRPDIMIHKHVIFPLVSQSYEAMIARWSERVLVDGDEKL